VIGASGRAIVMAIAPVLVASSVMAGSVMLVDRGLPALSPLPRLAILVAAGAMVYTGWLVLFARATLSELIATVKRSG
jgi:membrane protein DedA with SNARE-associated domain